MDARRKPTPRSQRRPARGGRAATRKPENEAKARTKTKGRAVASEPPSAARSSAGPRNVRRARRKPSDKPAGPGLGERLRGVRGRLGGVFAPLARPFALLMRVVLVGVALAGAVAVGRLVQEHLRQSEAFAIRSIDLTGLERIERFEALDAAGLAIGQNVFEVSPEVAEARLEKHPWVADAEVTRRLPGHYAVRIRERTAVALLVVETCADILTANSADECADKPASSLYLVSEQGTVFKRLEGEDPIDLPVITGVPRQRFGTDREFRSAVLLEAVALMHEYRAAGLWRRMPIAEIHLEADDGFSLYAGDELTHVRLGKPPFQAKLRRMRKVLDRLKREEASAAYVYLDNARRPDRVTVRLR